MPKAWEKSTFFAGDASECHTNTANNGFVSKQTAAKLRSVIIMTSRQKNNYFFIGSSRSAWISGFPFRSIGQGHPQTQLSYIIFHKRSCQCFLKKITFSPGLPGMPGFPFRPIGPVGPTSPSGPLRPTFPRSPCLPGIPRGPLTPFGPMIPAAPCRPWNGEIWIPNRGSDRIAFITWCAWHSW